jgi:uncharacterized membrane protein YbhN (UPF0104 family)
MSEGLEAARQTKPVEYPWIALGKLCATIALLIFLLRSLDLAAIAERLHAIDSSYALAAFGVGMIQIAVAGLRWRYIANAIKTADDGLFSTAKSLQITWAAQAVSQFTPVMAGDAIRVLLMRQTGSTLRTSFKSVLLDRGFGLAALLALTAASLLLAPQPLSASPCARLVAWVTWIGLGGTVLLFAFARHIGAWGARWPAIEVMTGAVLDMRRLCLSIRQAAVIAGLCLIVHAMSAVILALLVRSQAVEISAIDTLAIVSLMSLSAVAPFAFAGWGVREGLVVALSSAIGITPEASLLLSLSFGTVILVSSLPGGALFMLPLCPATAQRD